MRGEPKFCLQRIQTYRIRICCQNLDSVDNSKLFQLKPPEGGTPILGHIRDVRPEWVSFQGQKPADGFKFLTKNLQMGHNFDIILSGNRWFSSKLNKTYCSLVNFASCFIVNSLRMGLFLFIDGQL